MEKSSQKRGIMQIVLLAIIVIVALAYFNIDVRGIIDTPIIQKVFVVLKGVWYGYIAPLLGYLWTSIVGLFN